MLSFEDLFALRIYYLDEFEDESDVIKELKYKLLEQNMEEDDINKYLLEFYKSFGIDLPESRISEVKINENEDNNINNINHLINIFTNILQNTIQNNNIDFEDVKVTVKKEELDNLNKITVNEDEDKTCNICLCEYKKGEEKLILKCNHEFHYECIKKWLEEYNYKCPICRCETTKDVSYNTTHNIMNDSDSDNMNDNDSDI
jgi:hypothetical protein